jgi:ubiquitin carboxyl-terminal hydrolase 5/13
MEYERTQQYDFGKITEASAALEPVFGPGKTGLRNFGNTCYMATVLQCLFSIKPFQARFLRQHRETCEASDPYKCCECQTERIAEGLLSGAFSNPADPPELRGVTPRAFKKLFTERHTDFSTMQQQDAQEFLIFLLKEFSRRMPIRDATGAKKTPETDPTTVFDFVIEERQQCSACMAVRYKRHLQPNLSLSLPVLPFAGDKSKMTEEEIDASRPRTTLDACLAEMLLPGAIEGMVCPGCGTRAPFFTTSRLASFPDVFIFHARREYYDRNFQQVRKLDAYLDVPQELNLARLRSAGPQSDDVMLPAEADSSSATSAPSPAPMAVDETALAMMLSMGIDTLIAIWALQSTNNNVERAIDFVFSHPEGPPSIVTRQEDEPAAPASQTAVVAATDGAPNYRLSAMISHIGANAFSGHYVCHVLDECTGKWHLFNDEKVAVSQNPPFRMASIYFYKREGAAV